MNKLEIQEQEMGKSLFKATLIATPMALVGAGAAVLGGIEASIAVSTFVVATAGIGAIILGIGAGAAALYVTQNWSREEVIKKAH